MYRMEGHKVVFYDDGQSISKQVDRDERRAKVSNVSTQEYFEIDRTIEWINTNSFERVGNTTPKRCTQVPPGCSSVP